VAVAHLRARLSGALARVQRATGRREVEVGAGLGLHGAVHVSRDLRTLAHSS